MCGFRSQILLVMTALTAAGAMADTTADQADTIDWRAYVSRADMVWNGPKVQTLSWLESPFVGNGMLGVMLNTEASGCGSLWPGCSATPASPVLRLKIGRLDVWDTRVMGSVHAVGDQQYDTPRLPIGNLFVSPTNRSAGAIDRVEYVQVE